MNPSDNPNSDFSNMHRLWDSFGRHYIKSGIGDILINGNPHQFRITQFSVPDAENMPTKRRILTEMAPDIDRESDHTAIYFPGFSETSAQIEGDFASVLLGTLSGKGYRNPRLISINPCGKGTREYMEKADAISRIGVLDEIRDVRALVQVLLSRGKIQGDTSLIGHSMGALNAMGSLNVLKGKVKRMAQLMPCTDKPFGLTFSPRFLWTVRRHVTDALTQAYRRHGALSIAESDHNRIMFGIESTENEAGNVHDFGDHWQASLADSALRFVQMALNRKRLPEEIVPRGIGKGIAAHVLQAGRDRVIPDSMVRNQVKYLRKMEMSVKGDDPFLAPSFSHAIPMRMTSGQRGELEEFFGKVF